MACAGGSGRLRVALAQLDFLVGDVPGNAARIVEAASYARDALGADLVVFPELALTGYPPEDLLLRPGLYRRVDDALERIRADAGGIAVVLGYPHRQGAERYNAAALIREGRTEAVYRKHHLPNYAVFDEKRYFLPGESPCVVEVGGVRVGLTICEDVWLPGPAERAAVAGAQLLVNINASPYHVGKQPEREAVVRARLREARIPAVYLNLVGGQDELVFDGHSFVMDAGGTVVRRLPFCEEGIWTVDFEVDGATVRPVPGELAPTPEDDAAVYRVITLGVRDYVTKNGFQGAVLGLSGGIDSSLTLAIAVDALGADQIEAVMMPSRYTSPMSLEDAEREARALGVDYRVISIEPPFRAFLDTLAEEFAGLAADVTEENIQARSRGVILMAISNKKGRILLSTGNKSEMAVGYATLYGDMAGGFAPIKDVFKTRVYELARLRNRREPVIPERVLERPPSAELAPGQQDSDTLPPYPVLDPILQRYVEEDQPVDEIVAAGYDRETVLRVARMVDRAEYKRRQAPPGVRITRRAFGKDRRYPITSGYGRAGWD